MYSLGGKALNRNKTRWVLVVELNVAFLSFHLEVPSALGDEAGMSLRENKEMYPVH